MRPTTIAFMLLCALVGSAEASDADLIAEINRVRAFEGVTMVRPNPALGDAARRHALDLASDGRLSHLGTDGSTLGERLERSGYRYGTAAENLALGPASARDVIRLWRGSPPHAQNLVLADVDEAGAHCTTDARSGRLVWVLILARRFDH